MKAIRITCIILAICAVIVLTTFLTYSACQAFGREPITLTDNYYMSSDSKVILRVSEAQAVINVEGVRTVYTMEQYDNNLLKLTHGADMITAIVIDSGATVYISNLRTYVYKR